MVVNLVGATLQGVESVVVVVLLEVGESEEVVEGHVVRVVLRSGGAQDYHLVPLLLLPLVLYQLDTSQVVVGLEGERVLEGGINGVDGHALQLHVHSLHVGYVGILGRCCHGAIEQIEHHHAVAAVLLRLLYGLLQHGHLGLRFGLRAEQYLLAQFVGSRIVASGTIVVVHRVEGEGVLRVVGKCALEAFECLVATAVVHQPVAQHHLIVGFVGMGVVQSLEHAVGVLGVVAHLVYIHLHKCQLVALAVNLLYALYGRQHARVVLLGTIQAHEYVENIGTFAIVRVQIFVCLDCAVVVALLYICSCYTLLIGIVGRLQTCGTLHILRGERVVAHVGVLLCQSVESLSSVGVDRPARVEQAQRCRVVAP